MIKPLLTEVKDAALTTVSSLPHRSHLPPMGAILAIGQGSQTPKLDKPNSLEACDFVAISMSRYDTLAFSLILIQTQIVIPNPYPNA